MNNGRLKVLFAAFEVSPFVKTGGLGDVAGSLPNAIRDENVDIRVVMPLFSTIGDEYKNEMKKVAELYVPLGWRNQYIGIYKMIYRNVIYYFLDNEYYFYRDKIYGYFDDGERIAYFSKAILEFLQKISFSPDIIHLNDWHTALASVYLREMYRGIEKYDKMKSIITVHNLKFQGMYSTFVLDDIVGLGNNETAKRQLVNNNAVNFLRGGLNYTDFITTVSPTYANEIKTDYYGENLNDIFLRRFDIVKGILNGIDYEKYNPKTDKNIYVNYDIDTLQEKIKNKIALQKEKWLNIDENVPMVCMITRLTEQKGIDLVTAIFDELMCTTNCQFVLLATGDKKNEDSFRFFEHRYRGRVSSNIYFSEELSRKIYAASDLILIPSRFEPCGLTQMIAMKYLTLPIVRETGGLKDTVIPYNKYTNEGNGFSFANFNAHELLWTIKNAIELYNTNKNTFNNLIKNASNSDFSWEKSAKEYIKVYEKVLSY